MDENGFRDFCKKQKLKEKIIQANIGMVKEAEAFLQEKRKNMNLANARISDLRIIMSYLVEKQKNTWETFLALIRYASFVKNKKVEVALKELLDGSDVLENLSCTLRKEMGRNIQKEIFEGIKLPSLSASSKNKPEITMKFMERLEAKLGEKKSREILLTAPHAGPIEEYLTERIEFQKSKNIDAFLEIRHKEFIDLLEKHMKEKTLFYTQEIDEEVLEYVRNTPTCQNGVREGDIIYITKIPYMAKKYLHEKDEKKKRYYYCHCPWVREAIKSDLKVSPNFCYCSAGFEKRPWIAIFDQDVEADVLETVLKGDTICKFAIHIPEEYRELSGDDRKRKKPNIVKRQQARPVNCKEST